MILRRLAREKPDRPTDVANANLFRAQRESESERDGWIRLRRGGINAITYAFDADGWRPRYGIVAASYRATSVRTPLAPGVTRANGFADGSQWARVCVSPWLA